MSTAEIQYTLIPLEKPVITNQTIEEHELPYNLVGPPPDKALLDSIKTYGILQPLIVGWNGFRYKLIDGRRRLKAARLLGLTILPIVMVGHDQPIEDVLTVNVHATRSDNVASDVEAIEELLGRSKPDGTLYNEQDVAEATGLGVSTVRKRMRLTGLIEPLRVSLDEGKIARGIAEAAAKLSVEEQTKLLPALDKRGRINRIDIQELRRAVNVQEVAAIDFGALSGTPDSAEMPAPEIPSGPLTGDALADAVRHALEGAGLVVTEVDTNQALGGTVGSRLARHGTPRTFNVYREGDEEQRLLIIR